MILRGCIVCLTWGDPDARGIWIGHGSCRGCWEYGHEPACGWAPCACWHPRWYEK